MLTCIQKSSTTGNKLPHGQVTRKGCRTVQIIPEISKKCLNLNVLRKPWALVGLNDVKHIRSCKGLERCNTVWVAEMGEKCWGWKVSCVPYSTFWPVWVCHLSAQSALRFPYCRCEHTDAPQVAEVRNLRRHRNGTALCNTLPAYNGSPESPEFLLNSF